MSSKKGGGMRRYLYLIVIISMFLGCGAREEYVLFQKKESNTSEVVKEEIRAEEVSYIYQYKIVPGDIVEVRVYKHPELSVDVSKGASNEIKGLVVYPDGSIELPLIGRVEIAGLTEEEAARKLQRMYEEYIKRPYVMVKVLSKKVYVLGEVRKPGVIQLNGDYTTLIEAVSKSGGFTDMARRNKIIIISGGLKNPKIREVDLTRISALSYRKMVLKPNDIVYVQPSNMKPLDVRVQGVSPIVNLINSILSTFVNVKILSE